MKYLNSKKIVVTGCCGTVGKELLKQLQSNCKPAEVVGIDNNESELFFIDQQYLKESNFSFFLADLRDPKRMTDLFRDIDYVFHTAALKHVVLCERSPFEAVQSNIHGVQNVIDAAMVNEVSKVIFTSSDKAVNPTNVMGTSKLMGERLISAANSSQKQLKTVFASTRFGNVLGSNGSVVPIFHKQIASGGPVTLTDSEMTRFIMSIEEAASLILKSAEISLGGEALITKMPVIKIRDLAEVMIEELAPRYGHKPEDIQITEIGTKPGEKLYEELMSDEEIRRSLELKDYFSVLPAFRGMYSAINYDYEDVVSTEVDNPYNSAHEPALTQDELRKFLLDNKILEGADLDVVPGQRYWPGDKK
jgi:FlaA1/EpsC-like NDP-sugar epimerase